jgi:hypothetical protein
MRTMVIPKLTSGPPERLVNNRITQRLLNHPPRLFDLAALARGAAFHASLGSALSQSELKASRI